MEIPLYWSDPELVDPDFTMFPMTFRVDYVRLWQERGKERTSCSPADHPTNGWIRGHHVDYGVRGESLLGAGVWVGMLLVVAALAMALGGSTANMHLTAVAVQLAPLGILILWSVLSALGLDPNSPLYYVWWLQAVGVSAAVGSMFPDSTHVLGGASAAGLVGLLLAIDLGVDEGVGRIEGQGRIAAAFLGSALAGLLTFTLMHLRFRRGVVQAFSSALVGGVALTFGIALLTSCGEGAFDGGECGLGNVDVCLKGIRSNDCDGGFSSCSPPPPALHRRRHRPARQPDRPPRAAAVTFSTSAVRRSPSRWIARSRSGGWWRQRRRRAVAGGAQPSTVERQLVIAARRHDARGRQRSASRTRQRRRRIALPSRRTRTCRPELTGFSTQSRAPRRTSAPESQRRT